MSTKKKLKKVCKPYSKMTKKELREAIEFRDRMVGYMLAYGDKTNLINLISFGLARFISEWLVKEGIVKRKWRR